MPDPTYQYVPIYGVEPYENNAGAGDDTEFGGGAELTNNNLLVTLWTVDSLDVEGIPASGRLLRPFYADPLIPFQAFFDQIGLKNLGANVKQSFDSRTSLKFFLGKLAEDLPFAFAFPLLAVLNPPAEMKNRLANTFRNLRVDPASATGFSAQFIAGVAGQGAWNAAYADADNPAHEVNATGDTSFSFIPYFVSKLPYLKTNGADGVFPEFFPLTPTPMGTMDSKATYDALLTGDFYVAALITPLSDSLGWVVRIEWPHSLARG